MTGDALRKGFSFLVILIALGGVYWRYQDTRPCVHPITFRVGTYDSRFNISKATYQADLLKAAAMWNKALGRDLILYQADGAVPVNLVYDTRQQTANLGGQIRTAQQVYDAHKAQVDQEQAAYEKQRADFEAQVAYWNARGGAPADVYKTLEALRTALSASYQQLSADIAALNAEAKATNVQVGAYNAGVSGVIEAGLYHSDASGAAIELYEFTSTNQLVRIAAHEFGHALGLDHTKDPNSIMYPENKSETLALAPADLAALKTLCNVP